METGCNIATVRKCELMRRGEIERDDDFLTGTLVGSETVDDTTVAGMRTRMKEGLEWSSDDYAEIFFRLVCVLRDVEALLKEDEQEEDMDREEKVGNDTTRLLIKNAAMLGYVVMHKRDAYVDVSDPDEVLTANTSFGGADDDHAGRLCYPVFITRGGRYCLAQSIKKMRGTSMPVQVRGMYLSQSVVGRNVEVYHPDGWPRSTKVCVTEPEESQESEDSKKKRLLLEQIAVSLVEWEKVSKALLEKAKERAEVWNSLLTDIKKEANNLKGTVLRNWESSPLDIESMESDLQKARDHKQNLGARLSNMVVPDDLADLEKKFDAATSAVKKDLTEDEQRIQIRTNVDDARAMFTHVNNAGSILESICKKIKNGDTVRSALSLLQKLVDDFEKLMKEYKKVAESTDWVWKSDEITSILSVIRAHEIKENQLSIDSEKSTFEATLFDVYIKEITSNAKYSFLTDTPVRDLVHLVSEFFRVANNGIKERNKILQDITRGLSNLQNYLIEKWTLFKQRDKDTIDTMVSDLADANANLEQIQEQIRLHTLGVDSITSRLGNEVSAKLSELLIAYSPAASLYTWNGVISNIKQKENEVCTAVFNYQNLINDVESLKKAYENAIPAASPNVKNLIDSVTKQEITTSEMSISEYVKQSEKMTKSIPEELRKVMTEAQTPQKGDEVVNVESIPKENDRVRISDIPVTQQNHILVAVQVSGSVFRILRFISSRGTKYKDQLQKEEKKNIERYKQTGKYDASPSRDEKNDLLQKDADDYEKCVKKAKDFLVERQIESNIASIASTVKWRLSEGSTPYLDYDGERKLQLVVVPDILIPKQKEYTPDVADMRRDGIWLYHYDHTQNKKSSCRKCAVCDAPQADKGNPKSAGLIVRYDVSDKSLIKGLASRFCWHPRAKCKT